MKIKWHILFCLFLTGNCQLISVAQNNELDSLKKLTGKYSSSGKHDTAYINLLNTIAFKMVYLRPDSAILISNQTKTLSSNAAYLYGEADALKNLGLAYNVKGSYDSALLFFNDGLQIAEKAKFTALAGRLYHNTAIVYTNQGKYPPALENYFKALKMREESGEKLGQSSSSNGIGTVYFLQGKYAGAVSYYTKALTIAEEIDFKRGIESGYANIGEVFFKQGNYTEAKKNLLKALETIKQTGDLEIITFAKTMLGSVYLKEGSYDKAMQLFKEAGAVAEQLSSPEYSSRSLIGIGQTHLNLHHTDSALHYVLKGYKIAGDIKFVELQRDASEVLSTVYETKGNDKEALHYSRLFKIYADSINNQQAQQITANLAADYEYSKKELLLKADFDSKTLRQRWIIFSAFAALFSSLIVVWLVYRSRQKEKKTNRLLLQQKQEIEKQKTTAENALTELKAAQQQLIQSEKMASLGELTAGIAHEIQNPLNFVNNFSEVSKELLNEMAEEAAKGNIEQVKAIAADVVQNLEKINHHGKRVADIVKSMLQHSRSGSGKKEPTDINKLADEYLRLAYHGLRAKDKSFNAIMKTDFDKTIGNINIIQQDIGRVILNLINNAFYAAPLPPEGGFKDPNYKHEPTVWVSTSKIPPSGSGGAKVLISVKDNGPGIPKEILDKIFQPFFTTKPTGQGTGLGLSLSYDIVKAHGGELRVETKEGEGSAFIILLPAP